MALSNAQKLIKKAAGTIHKTPEPTVIEKLNYELEILHNTPDELDIEGWEKKFYSRYYGGIYFGVLVSFTTQTSWVKAGQRAFIDFEHGQIKFKLDPDHKQMDTGSD